MNLIILKGITIQIIICNASAANDDLNYYDINKTVYDTLCNIFKDKDKYYTLFYSNNNLIILI